VDFLDLLRQRLEGLLAERSGLNDQAEAIFSAAAAEQRSDLTDAEDAGLKALKAERTRVDTAITELEERVADIEAVRRSADDAAEKVRSFGIRMPGKETSTSGDDPLARGREFGSPTEVRNAAFRAIESVRGLEDDHRAAAESLVRRVDTPDGRLARHILLTGRDSYRSGFQKIMAGQPELMEDHERRAMSEARISSLTDAQGGYAVPFTLDPSIIHTSTYLGAGHPWRQLATVTSIVTDAWNGVSSAGVTASMAGEAEEVVDGSPTLAQPSIPVKKAQSFVRYTEEIYADWASYESEIRTMFAWAKDVLEDVQFTLGSGVGNNVNGIVTDLVAATSPVVATDTADNLLAVDLYKLEAALAKRFRTGASMVAARATFNKVRQLDTAGGAQLWERIGNNMPAQLLGYPVHEGENIDSTWGSGENYVLIFGDVRQAYRIIDRVGTTIQNFPALFGTTNNLPNGTGGLRMVWRFGAGVVNPTAAKILNVT